MRILVIGGDGFIGWPLTNKLQSIGHEVTVLDNLSARIRDSAVNIDSRVYSTALIVADTNDMSTMLDTLSEVKPECIVYLGEIRSAPYSMIDTACALDTYCNISGTLNLMESISKIVPTAHLIHIGSMGVYGYGYYNGRDIPEGFIGGEPAAKNPSSKYHLTKVIDTEIFSFYSRMYKLKITDLHQGIVWGHLVEGLTQHTRLDVDSIWGTSLNRFLYLAANNLPLRVEGTGDQTRAYIHIEDSIKCLIECINNPPNEGYRVYNQYSESFTVNEAARGVLAISGGNIEYDRGRFYEVSKNLLSSKSTIIERVTDRRTTGNYLTTELQHFRNLK